MERTSQESRVTSTPLTQSPRETLSPSVSSIAHHDDEEVPMEVDLDSELSLTNSHESGDTSSSDRLRALKPAKWFGFWNSLKPIDKSSLYYKVFNHPNDLKDLVIDLVNLYNQSNEKTIGMILQLFINLSGYAHLNLSQHYDFEHRNSKELIKKMENELMENDLKITGKFLFVKDSEFTCRNSMILSEFFKYFVIRAFKNGVLFDKKLIPHIIEFLGNMCFSLICPLRVTGVILSAKLLTAVTELYKSITSLMSDENVDYENKDVIEGYIDYLYLICNENCLIPDKKCYMIKIICAQEMLHWMRDFPNMFIVQKKCLKRLLRLVKDQSATVRNIALTSCKKLINCREIEVELTSTELTGFFKIIKHRVLDINVQVAVISIDIVGMSFERYSRYIVKSHRILIIHRIYEKNILVAKAAGKFLWNYCRVLFNTDENILRALIKIAFLENKFAMRLPFFLEACLDFFPQLINWTLMIEYILNDKKSVELRRNLIHIFYQMCRYHLTGNFTNARQTLMAGPKNNDTQALFEILIKHFSVLLKKFHDDVYVVKLTDILTFFNSQLDFSHEIENLHQTLLDLKCLFYESMDRKILENLARFFRNFSEQQNHQEMIVIVEEIKQNYVEILIVDLSFTAPISETIQTRIDLISMKIAILLANFDLTDQLNWNHIFTIWDYKSYERLKYIIVSCKWYLIWCFRKFKKNTDANNTTLDVNLFNYCKNFIYKCLEIFTNPENHPAQLLVFETICDYYIEFEKELLRYRRFNIVFIKLTDKQHEEGLIKFVCSSVIEDTQLSLQRRQMLLTKFVNIMSLGAMRVNNFASIFKYLETHYDEFAAIFNHLINEMNSLPPTLPLTIVNTLYQYYNNILAEEHVINIRSERCKKLKLLAKKFIAIRAIKSSSDLLKLVNMSIHFALRRNITYSFLYFVRYFAENLDAENKLEVSEMFSKQIPKADKNNEMLLLFASCLKP